MIDIDWPNCDGSCKDMERVHRPYEHDPIPSISTLAGVSDDGAFDGVAFAAGRIAAEYMLNYGIDSISPEKPFDKVLLTASRVPKAQWDTDAKLGTLAHDFIEHYTQGQQWVGPDDLYEWDNDRLNLFVDHAMAWIEHRKPELLACEFIVSNPELGYVGTGDMLFADGIDVVLEDTKTQRVRKKSITSKFGKWNKQLMLINGATHLRHYHGTALIAEVPWDETPMPRPNRGLILAIDPDGFREYAVDITVNPRLLDALAAVIEWKPNITEIKRPRSKK